LWNGKRMKVEISICLSTGEYGGSCWLFEGGRTFVWHFIHAGMTPVRKESGCKTAFYTLTDTKYRGTIAFGDGHWQSKCTLGDSLSISQNLEGIITRNRRAGRDGLPSETRLIYNMSDFVLYRSVCGWRGKFKLWKKDFKWTGCCNFAEAKSCRRKNYCFPYFVEAFDQDVGIVVCDNPPKTLTAPCWLKRKSILHCQDEREGKGLRCWSLYCEALNNAGYMLAAIPKLKPMAWEKR